MEKRNTVQRTLVLQAVRTLGCHPDADNVYAEIVKKHSGVSKATVYRNLHSLCDDGILRKVSMPNAADRFDHNSHGHYHMQCIMCKKLSDAPCAYNEALDIEVCATTSFTSVSHDLFISGLCSECSKNII